MRTFSPILIGLLLAMAPAWPLGGVSEKPSRSAEQEGSTTATDGDLADAAAVKQTVDRIFSQLAAAGFQDRRRANDDLIRLSEDAEFRSSIAQRMAERLASPQTTSEERGTLEKLWPQLTAGVELKPMALTAEQVQVAIAELNADQYAVRAAAAFRLRQAVQTAEEPVTLFLTLQQAAKEAEDFNSRSMLFDLYQELRLRWLTSEPGSWKFPPMEPGTIENHIALLATEPTQAAANLLYAQAEQDLTDLLLRPEYSDQVRDQLAARLDGPPLSPATRERLQQILDLTRHLVVLEGWVSRGEIRTLEQVEVQPLANSGLGQLLNAAIPLEESIIRAASDQQVSIVASPYLPEGDYPVGRSIYNENSNAPVFQIVNLSSPRRHLLYRLERSQATFAQRLRAVSQRTITGWIERGERLSQHERVLLDVLNPELVSERAPELLLAAGDFRPDHPEVLARAGVRASHHHEICYALATHGRATAAPGILQAMEAGVILPPDKDDAPFDWPTIALFCIARRDPWVGAEEWLQAQLDSAEPLRLGDVDERGWKSSPPMARAAAAVILLKNRGQDPESEQFGLKRVRFRVLDALGCPSYHFRTEDDFRRTLDWLIQHPMKPTR